MTSDRGWPLSCYSELTRLSWAVLTWRLVLIVRCQLESRSLEARIQNGSLTGLTEDETADGSRGCFREVAMEGFSEEVTFLLRPEW